MAESESKKFSNSLHFPILVIVALWAIHTFQYLADWKFSYLGIYPQSISGLKGILFAPLIHSDLAHLINNSVPLFVLLTIIKFFYPKVATRSFIMIYILTGIAVWSLARSVYHIGASGVVYGLVAFVFWTGIFRRSLKAIVLALIVTIMYSGMFMGILPDQEGISWESHLFGAFVGIFTAYFYKEELEADEEKKEDPFKDEPAYADRPFFLPRDTFEKTRTQRRLEAEQERIRIAEQKRLDGDWTSSSTWEVD